MQTCKLCRKEVEKLAYSHIIPECLYSELYDEKHRFIAIKSDNYYDLNIEQKGYREYLLCDECETKLSVIENRLKKDFVDISTGESRFLKITKINPNFRIVENINSRSFRKSILSILWRMSISTLPVFNKYKLGPHEEKLRLILKSENDISAVDYPIFIRRVVIGDEHHTGLMLGIGKGRILDKYLSQSFVVFGYLISVVVSSQTFSKKYQIVSLSDTGMIPIKDISLSEINQNKGLTKRLYDSDIADFYRKTP